MRRRLAAALLVAVPTGLAAQAATDAPPCTADAPPRPQTIGLGGPADVARVVLCADTEYRIESDRGGGVEGRSVLEVRPVEVGTPTPFVREGLAGRDVEEGESWTVQVKATALYELRMPRVARGGAVTLSLRPRVLSDKERARHEEKEREAIRKEMEKARREREKAERKAREAEEKRAKSDAGA